MYLEKGILTKRLVNFKKEYRLKDIFFDLSEYHELIIPKKYITKYSAINEVKLMKMHTTLTKCIREIIADNIEAPNNVLLIGIFNIEYVEEHYYIYYAVINNPKEE